MPEKFFKYKLDETNLFDTGRSKWTGFIVMGMNTQSVARKKYEEKGLGEE